MVERRVSRLVAEFIVLILFLAVHAAAQQSPFVNDSDDVQLNGFWSDVEYPLNAGASDYNQDGYKDLYVTFKESLTNPKNGIVVKGWYILGHTPVFHTAMDPLFGAGDEIAPGCEGLLFADFNNDGYRDFYAPNRNGHQLYQYDPDNDVYVDISSTISTPNGFDQTINGAWGDYNADGWVDLLLLKYSGEAITGQPYSSEQRVLINNGGNGWTMAGSSVTGIDNSNQYVLSALWTDFSGDGFIDLVEFQCAGSGQTSRYYKNIYHDILGSRVMQVATTAAMQVVFDKIVHQGLVAAAADANNDGALDVLFHSDANYGAILTDTSNPSEFLPLTIDRTGIGYNGYYPPASWNISTIDYDLNGDMDFAVARYDGLKKSAFFPPEFN